MQWICDHFSQGTLSHESFEDIKKQILQEGDKRVEAFVFEGLFKEQVLKSVKDEFHQRITFDWYMATNRWDHTKSFFKLILSESDWNDCDDVFAGKILNADYRASVYLVTLENNEFVCINRRDGKKIRLVDILPIKQCRATELNREQDRRRIRSFDRMTTSKRLKIDWRALSIHRRLINCYLEPGFKRAVSDLDMLVLNDRNEVKYIEFKRKYPSRGKEYFGLDEFPHVKNIQWLYKIGVSTGHILLVNPSWNPTCIMVDDATSALDSRWIWLCCDIDPTQPLSSEKMVAHGDKSGKNRSTKKRFQYKISWAGMSVLSRSLSLNTTSRSNLFDYILYGKRPVKTIDYNGLYDHCSSER